MSRIGIITVRHQVAISLMTDVALTGPNDLRASTPAGFREQDLATLLAEVLAWSDALAQLRPHLDHEAETVRGKAGARS
jgi:hypothetical protein